MEAMRQSWTDERLDDFREETARRFGEVNRRFDRIDADIRELRGGMDAINARLDQMNARIDALNQTILKLGGGAFVTFVIGFGGLIATQL